MQGNCGACKWWSATDYQSADAPTGWGNCELITLNRASEARYTNPVWTRYWDENRGKPRDARTPLPKEPSTLFKTLDPPLLAYAQDGSDYAAGVVSHKDFGCVQFEEEMQLAR